MKAKTYFEKRLYINEQVLDELLKIVANDSPHLYPQIDSLAKGWDKATDQLDEEFKDNDHE